MRKPSDGRPDPEDLRLRVLGLGEQSLRKSHYPELRKRMRELERFRTLLDASTDGILMIELPSRRCVDANRAALAMLATVGEPDGGFSVEANLPSELEWLETAPGARRARVQLRGPAGTLAVELTADRRQFEGRDYAVFVLRDIRDQLEAERRRSESEERFRQLADLLPAIVYEADLHGRLTFVNRHSYQLGGFGEGEDWNTRPLDDFIAPKDRERARQNIQRVIAGENVGANRYDFVRADGTTFPVVARSTPILRDGKLIGIRGLLLDVTERVTLEEQARISQKLASMGRFAGSVAHDFNNVLGGIQGLCDLAIMDLPESSGAKDDILDIKRAATRAAELIRQLLLFSRKQPSAGGPASFNIVIRQVERMVARVIGVDIELTIDLADDLWCVAADPSHLDQVVMNLVLNARDAMPAGGKLTITTQNINLTHEEAATFLGDAVPGEHVRLRVEDTGRGIDPAVQERLFEPFFTTKPVGEGTGLGLATVYGVVSRHRGGVRVSSEPGRGTTFDIILPRVAEAVTAPEDRSEPDSARGVGNVLVAEDDDMIRSVVRRALTRYGYRVLTAPNPTAALALAREHERIDLLLSDVIMPDMSGFTLADRFHEIHPDARILFMSGYSEDGQASASMEAIQFLQKPFTVQQLLERIAALLG